MPVIFTEPAGYRSASRSTAARHRARRPAAAALTSMLPEVYSFLPRRFPLALEESSRHMGAAADKTAERLHRKCGPSPFNTVEDKASATASTMATGA